MKEKLLEMLEMQKALNQNILEEYGNEKYTWDNLLHALFDELGELNHELKAKWCWWKKTQKPVDREKLLEEYVDCIHFGLCMILKRKGNLEQDVAQIEEGYYTHIYHDIIYCDNIYLYFVQIVNPGCTAINRFINLLGLGYSLGFTFDTIYKAYIKKNKVNHERLKEGY